MSIKRVLIFGDSHTHAVRQACDRRRAASRRGEILFEAYRFSKIKNGEEIGDYSLEAAMDMIAALRPEDMIVSTIGGNQHASFGLVQHPEPFDFLEPGTKAQIDWNAVTFIPYSTLWQVFERGLRGRDGTRLQQIRQVAKCRMLHLAPPPPKEDETHILKRFETDFGRKGILEHGVTPAPLRLKLWSLQIEVTRRLCGEWNIEFVPVPDAAISPKGFLRPDYYANDATHANEAYGELVLEQLEDIALRSSGHRRAS